MHVYILIGALLIAALIRQIWGTKDAFSSLDRYYLSGDGSWNLLPSAMIGASSAADGVTGLVPVPLSGTHGAYLRGDGNWVQPANIPAVAQYLMVTSNANQPAAKGAIFQFPDTLAASGTAIVNTADGFVLQANYTYKCTAQFTLTSTEGYLDYIWYNVTTGKSFGEGGGIAAAQFYAMAVGYITTVVPTTIGLYITYNQSSIAVSGNNKDSPYMRGPWAIIEVVSNNNTISTPVAVASSSAVAYQGMLTSIVLLNGGTLYATAPAVTISRPPAGGVPATAQATIVAGVVVAIVLVNRGYGYVVDPVVTIAAPQPGGIQAAAIAYAVYSGLESPSNCGNLVGSTSGSAYIMADGSVRVLGRNDNGCQGIGNVDINNTTPVPMMWAENGWAAPAAVRIWAAYVHKYVLGADGYLYGTGWNDQGGLGLGHTTTAFVLTRTLLPIGLVKFACSNGVSANPSCLALLGNGQLYGWGWNATGELGLGHTKMVTTPTRIPLDSSYIDAQYTVTAIYCAGDRDTNVSYLLLSNGQVMAAGTNTYSQCGNGNGTNQSTFGFVQTQQPICKTHVGLLTYSGQSTMPAPTYSDIGNTYLSASISDVTPTVRILQAGTYVITIPAINNYNVGGYPTVYISKNREALTRYTFPSTGNVGTLAAAAPFAAGDKITVTSSGNVNLAEVTISLVSILTGITQIAVSGADNWVLAAFFNAAAGTCHYSGYAGSLGPALQTTYAARWTSPITAADPPVAIFASGNGQGGSYGAANMAALTAAGNLWSWGYTCLRPVAENTQPTPGLSWSAGGIRKVCLYSYMNNAVGVILLSNGTIYYNGISVGNASAHYRSASGTTANTGGNWVRSYLHRRDIVDITLTGDIHNPNVQVLTSTGEVYISGWNAYGQLGVGDTKDGRLTFVRALF